MPHEDSIQMRITFFSHYFPPEVNAPATRVYEHTVRWKRAGHEIKVIDNLSTGRIENLAFAEGNPRFEFIRGTVSDKETMEKAFETLKGKVEKAENI